MRPVSSALADLLQRNAVRCDFEVVDPAGVAPRVT